MPRFVSVTSLSARVCGVLLVPFLAGIVAAQAQTNLLTNGNFEADALLTGWTTVNVRDPTDVNQTRDFLADKPGTTTPNAVYRFFSPPNGFPGGGGNYYAVSVSDYPGESALLQAFTTPSVPTGGGLKVTFTFDWFVNDQSGYSNTLSNPSGLDYTTGGTYQNNQYARVDLITASAATFSTSVADVLFNVPLSVPINLNPGLSPNPYQRTTVDLSPYVQAGKTYKIRFAEVDNLSPLNFGVDNVSITASITAEPATLPFFAVAPAALLLVRLLRRRRVGAAERKIAA